MSTDITQTLFNLMEEGKGLELMEGQCNLQVTDGANHKSIYLISKENKLSRSEVAEDSISNVSVKMSEEVLSMILSNLDTFDMRDTSFVSQVSVEGDVTFASELFGLIKRPSERTTNYLKETEAKCEGYAQSIKKIEKIANPSEDEVIDLINRSIPFVMTGVLDHWEFVSSSFEGIREKYRDVRLRSVQKGDEYVYETMGDFIDKVLNTSDSNDYTGGCSLPPAMWSKFRMPFFDTSSFSSPQLWMGARSGERACTKLHRDCINGMLANVFGRKKMVLFSPEQAPLLYTKMAYNTFQTCEIHDLASVDISAFPQYRSATPVEVVVGPGELLVLPAFWFHEVYAVDPVLSVSYGLKWDAWEEINSDDQTVELSI